jgi:hypothetical protein
MALNNLVRDTSIERALKQIVRRVAVRSANRGSQTKLDHKKIELRSVIGETLNTLTVTTYHPIGWSLARLQKRFQKNLSSLSPKTIEHESPVVFVHGIFHNSTAFYRIERGLRKNQFTNHKTVELWTSLSSVENMAAQLKADVMSALNRAKLGRGFPFKARLVAHSLGGMVVRVALLDSHFAKHIDKVVFLGTPHQGSPFYHFPLPRCLKDLSPNSRTMHRLVHEPLPGNILYWNLRGALDIVTPRAATFLPHVPNMVFEGVGHAGLLSDPGVVESVVEILEMPLYDAGSNAS